MIVGSERFYLIKEIPLFFMPTNLDTPIIVKFEAIPSKNKEEGDYILLSILSQGIFLINLNQDSQYSQRSIISPAAFKNSN